MTQHRFLRGLAAILLAVPPAAAAWAEDADEPNDTEASALVTDGLGFLLEGRFLSIGDTDVVRVPVPLGTPSFLADVVWDRAAYSGTASLSLTDADGSPVADGAFSASTGGLRVATGPLFAGEYLLVVRHTGGGEIADYSVQAHTALTFQVQAGSEASAGVPIAIPVEMSGGVAPYAVAIDDGPARPQGLVFDAGGPALSGVVGVAGRYDFTVTCRDSGSPASRVSVLVSLVVSDRLDVRLGEFTAFARGRSAARPIPASGGLTPFVAETVSGSLPAGVSFAESALAFVGSASTAGSAPIVFRAMDVLGSEDLVSTTAVVCDPVGVVALGAGRSAAGVWLDAVKGSRIGVTLTTAKNAPVRQLHVLVLASDGTTAVSSAWRSTSRRNVLSGVTAPESGRYYVVFAGDEGPAMPLLVAAKVALPTKGSGRVEGLAAGGEAEVSFGAAAGSLLTFSARPDAASGLEIRVKSVVGPDGAPVAIGEHDVTRRGSAVTLAKVLPSGGTWTVVLSGTRGGTGRVAYGYAVRAPRGAIYSIE